MGKPFKVVSIGDTGSSSKFGADDTDNIGSFLNNQSDFHNYTFLVYKEGSSYKAKNSDTGTVDYSGSVFHTVLNDTIDACSDGDTVAIREGTYTRTGSIVVQKNDFTLKGLGKCLIQGTGSGTSPIQLGDGGSTTFSGITIDGLTIDMQDYTPSGAYFGVLANKANNSVIQNCEIKNQTATEQGAGGISFADSLYCSIINNHIHDLINGIAPSTGCKGFRIIGNLVHDIDPYDGITPYQTLGYHTIVGNTCYNCDFAGINLDGGLTSTTRNNNSVIIGNVCHSNTLYGIQIYSSWKCSAVGNQCYDNDNYGIILNAIGDVPWTVSGNVCSENGIAGIGVYESRFGTITGNNCESNVEYGAYLVTNCHRNNISGNSFYLNGKNGLRLDASSVCNITGNSFINNGQTTDATYSDVLMRNTSIANIVLSNSFTNDLANKTKYGIEEEAGADTLNMIFWNWLSGSNTTAGILKNGSTSKLKGNSNHISENSGTAVVANGTTSIAVNHGLAITPSINNIMVTPTNSMGNAAKYYISTVTSTQFTINVNADPGATTATFVWSIV